MAQAAAAAAAAAASNSSRRKKRKAPGAPLVDSSLLRYVSEQKGESESQLQFWDWFGGSYIDGSGGEDGGTGATSTITTIDNPNALPGSMVDAALQEEGDEETAMATFVNDIDSASTTPTSSLKTKDATFSSSPSSSVLPTTAASSVSPPSLELIQGQAFTTSVDAATASLGQFNQHRIAQKLVALGADPDLAQVAGQSVQRHLLVRTARRRIRIFLRQRDDLWRDPSPTSNRQLLGTAPTRQAADESGASTTTIPFSASPNYGLDDVLEVMQEFGLSGVDICAILTHSPGIALMMPRPTLMMMPSPDASTQKSGETVAETLERSLNLLLMKTLGLRRYDARKVLRNTPGLLTMKGSKSAEQVVNMMTKLGVSEKSMSRDLLSLPVLLSRSPAGIFRLISFLCGNSVRIPLNQIGPLLRRRVSRELMNAVVPIPVGKGHLLPSKNKKDGANDSNNMSDDADDPITEVAFWSKTREERKDRIEAVYRNMTQTVLTLRDEIGTHDLGKVVAAYPSVLLLDVDLQIMPVARFLMDDLGFMDGDLASVLQLYPMLLGKDIDDMKRVVNYLEHLGVEEDDLRSIFRAFPALLTMKIEEMYPVVEYLQSIGVTNIGAFVTRIPPVLGYSVEKELKPKWLFLTTVCMHANFELNKFPNYFSYPFERVIKTRYEYLAIKGISRQLIPIDAVLRFGDVDFATTVARDDDDGRAFKSYCKRRQAPKEENRRGKGRRNLLSNNAASNATPAKSVLSTERLTSTAAPPSGAP